MFRLLGLVHGQMFNPSCFGPVIAQRSGDDSAWWGKMAYFMAARKQRVWERKGPGSPYRLKSHLWSSNFLLLGPIA